MGLHRRAPRSRPAARGCPPGRALRPRTRGRPARADRAPAPPPAPRRLAPASAQRAVRLPGGTRPVRGEADRGTARAAAVSAPGPQPRGSCAGKSAGRRFSRPGLSRRSRHGPCRLTRPSRLSRLSRLRLRGPFDEGPDVLHQLVLDLHVPGHLGHVHDDKQPGDDQRLDGRDPEVLDPFADADPNREVVRVSGGGDLSARSAAITPASQPPLRACITDPSVLGAEVWVLKPWLPRYSSMWAWRALRSVPLPWKRSSLSPITAASLLASPVNVSARGCAPRRRARETCLVSAAAPGRGKLGQDRRAG